jgi:hypothetical protein
MEAKLIRDTVKLPSIKLRVQEQLNSGPCTWFNTFAAHQDGFNEIAY